MMDKISNKSNPSGNDIDNKSQQIPVITATSFSGPLPIPTQLKEYDIVLPGAAERILSMAEKQLEHRISMEKKTLEVQTYSIKESLKQSKIGQYLGFIASMGLITISAVLVLNGHDVSGGILGSGTVVGLAAVFINGRQKSKDNSIQDDEQSQ
jgi:uncharacterized membrane protein